LAPVGPRVTRRVRAVRQQAGLLRPPPVAVDVVAFDLVRRRGSAPQETIEKPKHPRFQHIGRVWLPGGFCMLPRPGKPFHFCNGVATSSFFLFPTVAWHNSAPLSHAVAMHLPRRRVIPHLSSEIGLL